MSKADMASATKDELMNLMSVLGMNRVQFAHFCTVSANTVGWWLKECNVPKFRFFKVGTELNTRLGQTELTSEQRDAKALVERVLGIPLEVVAASGSAVPTNSKSLFNGDEEALRNGPGRVQPLSAEELTDTKNQLLALFDIDDLLREIKRRMSSSKEQGEKS
jgi:hypothetical protein